VVTEKSTYRGRTNVPLIELSRGPVEYRHVEGTSSRPPVVFLHEGLGCVATWGRFPDRVARATGRDTIIYSRHGFGFSGPAWSSRTPWYMHHEAYEVLPEFLDRLALESPVLIGHSEGGSISLLHAARYPVAQLVAMAPHVFVEPLTLNGIGGRVESYRDGGLAKVLAQFHSDPHSTFRAWSDIWLSPAFREWNIEADLAGVDCPVLLLQGEKDQFGTQDQLVAIERAVRGPVRRVDLPDCGHSPHLERADESLRAITTFLTVGTGRETQPPSRRQQ
jgi:pimeloyl-ACP methyl ester carboxylesterase